MATISTAATCVPTRQDRSLAMPSRTGVCRWGIGAIVPVAVAVGSLTDSAWFGQTPVSGGRVGIASSLPALVEIDDTPVPVAVRVGRCRRPPGRSSADRPGTGFALQLRSHHRPGRGGVVGGAVLRTPLFRGRRFCHSPRAPRERNNLRRPPLRFLLIRHRASSRPIPRLRPAHRADV